MKDTQVIILLPNEQWWGGRAADGSHMPYGAKPFEADLFATLGMNQAAPLLLSNKGRYIWSDQPFSFSFTAEAITITGLTSEIVVQEGFGSLRGAFQAASRQHFPTSGAYPDELLFTAPQYNLWIELLYQPTQEKVLAYARSVLAAGMAPGVIMIDDNWHEPYGNWVFHSGRFPDPKGMVDQLHQMGFKVMLWVCPFVSPDSRTFRELEDKGYLLKDKHGNTAIRHWWNGYSGVLDGSHEEAVTWFKQQLSDLQHNYGIDGFKLDAGDIEFYEASDQSAAPSTPHEQCEAWARIGLEFSLNEYRACWKLGGQPLAQRLKDKLHTWEGNGLSSLIPDALAQGLLGHPFICPDMIGGGEYEHFLQLSASLDQELFVRSAQCAALFPMMQFSAAPWRVLDEEHHRYCVQAADLHTRLGSEILELAKQASQDGEPMMRHLAYAYPEVGYERISDQFLLGDYILVAPVLEKGAIRRKVTFPPGIWVNEQGDRIVGPCTNVVDAPIDVLPWYRKV
ncbi:alpha-glucosidase (family GH31 glycosyl hydrolase) [Paenibacillus shirakamiensis]|uniref:Alpha-glucosidase (Family GH31 glycosyl hydrolase) n=1 Tax=Paenibacillus shirakamiensis TaxID=1265935 RepID=A0ABS4JHZ2_9BACL|nr:glycoside hydrolase family 31 protein [Paenibacillus shirakamiensis]MBP2000159.1 alpha-glucosidase (family GH31 glycosyl hydrolase) [Paenibacillus shirakamiensis]